MSDDKKPLTLDECAEMNPQLAEILGLVKEQEEALAVRLSAMSDEEREGYDEEQECARLEKVEGVEAVMRVMERLFVHIIPPGFVASHEVGNRDGDPVYRVEVVQAGSGRCFNVEVPVMEGWMGLCMVETLLDGLREVYGAVLDFRGDCPGNGVA